MGQAGDGHTSLEQAAKVALSSTEQGQRLVRQAMIGVVLMRAERLATAGNKARSQSDTILMGKVTRKQASKIVNKLVLPSRLQALMRLSGGPESNLTEKEIIDWTKQVVDEAGGLERIRTAKAEEYWDEVEVDPIQAVTTVALAAALALSGNRSGYVAGEGDLRQLYTAKRMPYDQDVLDAWERSSALEAWAYSFEDGTLKGRLGKFVKEVKRLP